MRTYRDAGVVDGENKLGHAELLCNPQGQRTEFQDSALGNS